MGLVNTGGIDWYMEDLGFSFGRVQAKISDWVLESDPGFSLGGGGGGGAGWWLDFYVNFRSRLMSSGCERPHMDILGSRPGYIGRSWVVAGGAERKCMSVCV